MLYARKNKEGTRWQPLREHSRNVADLTAEFAGGVGLKAMGELAGMLHDAGKSTPVWQDYLKDEPQEKLPHAAAGAKLLYRAGQPTPYHALTAQILGAAIQGHHGSLHDMISLDPPRCYAQDMQRRDGAAYDEAFFKECLRREEVSRLLDEAAEEMQAVWPAIKGCAAHFPAAQGTEAGNARNIAAGLLVRYVYSCLIDADRLDAAAWEAQTQPEEDYNGKALWATLAGRLETYLAAFPANKPVDRLRRDISNQCRIAADRPGGIYQLLVPTGGGKTLSGLRFALNHAAQLQKDRIFYIIPYTTIIDQTADELRKALGEEECILEHHSNLVDEEEAPGEELSRREKLALRWNAPIVLTTQVQFLNTLFAAGSAARRMHMLRNSVLIFDEAQTVPLSCLNLFNCAVQFLCDVCGCTAVLCTATQPALTQTDYPLRLSTPAQLIENPREAFMRFRRVRMRDARTQVGGDTQKLADFVLDRFRKTGSVLVIRNTKKAVAQLYKALKDCGAPVYHLSTAMCAAHRTDILNQIRQKLPHTPVICVSTNLIEAGVDISFSCVIRALAGLDSIAQAAGRCNRHGEVQSRDVFLIDDGEQGLSYLPDVRWGRSMTQRILNEYAARPGDFDNDLLSPRAMKIYYQYYYGNAERRAEMIYQVEKQQVSGLTGLGLVDLLGANAKMCRELHHTGSALPAGQRLFQAFATAGRLFHVIPDETRGVLTPYGQGEALAEELRRCRDMSQMKRLLKRAQRFSVNLYRHQLSALDAEGALEELGVSGVLYLNPAWYDAQRGALTARHGDPDNFIL